MIGARVAAIRVGVGFWLLVSLSACATVYVPEEIDGAMGQAVTSAQALIKLSRPFEAGQFVQAAASIDPEYPGLVEIRSALNPEAASTALVEPSLLGSNRARRYEVERDLSMKILLYLPDRAVDLLDCFTFEVHFGPGVFIKYYVTRAAQIGFGIRGVVGFGTYGNRTIFGVNARSAAEFSVGPVGVLAEGEGIASAAGVTSGYQTLTGLQFPTAEYSQRVDDYWSVGVAGTFGTFGADLALHPVQIGDFFAGLALVDFLGDDFAHTRGLSLSGEDEALLIRLGRMSRSAESLAAYRRSREPAAQ